MQKDSTTNELVYFTIMPSNAGFTDQLFQFSVFYKIGLSLGYSYLHSDFTSKRSGSEQIYDFLGFNEHFKSSRITSLDKLYRLMGTNNYFPQKNITLRNKIRNIVKFVKYRVLNALFFNEYSFIDIGLHDDTPHEEKGDPVTDFQNLVRKIVKQKSVSNRNRKTVVRLYAVAGIYFFRKLAPSISQQIPYFSDHLDLRSTYSQCRENSPVASNFSKDRLNILFHIRLGDTAFIETPWHSFVPLWSGNDIRPLREFPDKSSEVFSNVMDVTDFYLFLKMFVSFIDTDNSSMVVFSDGYKTTFNEIFRMIDDLHLNTEKLASLKKASATYEKDRFSVFSEIDNIVCAVGENNSDLQELIHSSLLADVIIVGCNQRMIPKFLSTYYDARLDNPPIIISLYKGSPPDYEEKLGLNASKAVVCPVNLNNIDVEKELIDVIDKLKHRQTLKHHAC